MQAFVTISFDEVAELSRTVFSDSESVVGYNEKVRNVQTEKIEMEIIGRPKTRTLEQKKISR